MERDFTAADVPTLNAGKKPPATVDRTLEAAFYERFLDITGGLTTIIISHRFATVRRADQIAVLERPNLEKLSCECYAVVKRDTDRLLSSINLSV